MTKEEFISKLPNRIENACFGSGELVVVLDLKEEKAACYWHENQQSTYKTYGHSWQAVYTDMVSILSKTPQASETSLESRSEA